MKKRNKTAQKPWTIKEVLFIHENYKNMTLSEMAESLGRGYGSVKNKVLDLGLKRTPKRETLEYAYYNRDELVCMGKIHEIEEYTGISKKNLFMYKIPSYNARLQRILIEVQ